MPRRSNITQSYLRLWPILRIAGSSSSGFSFASTSVGGELLGPLGEHVVAAMLERDVAGLVAVGGEADPDQLGGDAVAPVGLGVDRDPALGVGLGDPAVERRLVGDGLVERAVDLRLGPDLGLGRRLRTARRRRPATARRAGRAASLKP